MNEIIDTFTCTVSFSPVPVNVLERKSKDSLSLDLLVIVRCKENKVFMLWWFKSLGSYPIINAHASETDEHACIVKSYILLPDVLIYIGHK